MTRQTMGFVEFIFVYCVPVILLFGAVMFTSMWLNTKPRFTRWITRPDLDPVRELLYWRDGDVIVCRLGFFDWEKSCVLIGWDDDFCAVSYMGENHVIPIRWVKRNQSLLTRSCDSSFERTMSAAKEYQREFLQ